MDVCEVAKPSCPLPLLNYAMYEGTAVVSADEVKIMEIGESERNPFLTYKSYVNC